MLFFYSQSALNDTISPVAVAVLSAAGFYYTLARILKTACILMSRMLELDQQEGTGNCRGRAT
jgi:hypothetical protein